MPELRSAPDRLSRQPGFGYLSDWYELAREQNALALERPARKALKAEIKKGNDARRRLKKFTKKNPGHPAVELAGELDGLDLSILFVLLRNAFRMAVGSGNVFKPVPVEVVEWALCATEAASVAHIGRLAEEAPLRHRGLVLSGSAASEPLLTSWFYPSHAALRLAFGDDEPTCTAIADAIPRPSVPLDGEEQGSLLVWPDAVAAQMDRVIHAAKTRRRVLEEAGLLNRLPAARGLHVLLQGPPGTGKTLAAHTLAARLERPLRIVHVPDIQSRWIGVAEKTVRDMYRRAAREKVVLCVDEVDGLIVRRDADTKPWIRSLVDTFLVEMEAFEGVALYTTNHPEYLDEALDRRLSFRIEVPRPGPGERAKIWAAHLPPSVPVDAEVDFDALAERDLTGGEIQNAVLAALTEASLREPLCVTGADLEAGIRTAVRSRCASSKDRVGFAR